MTDGVSTAPGLTIPGFARANMALDLDETHRQELRRRDHIARAVCF